MIASDQPISTIAATIGETISDSKGLIESLSSTPKILIVDDNPTNLKSYLMPFAIKAGQRLWQRTANRLLSK